MSPGTASEVDGLERTARLWLARTPRARVAITFLEPGCGTGRYVRVLAARGHRVFGFDHELRMIDFADATLRRRGLRRHARVFVASMTDFVAKLGPARIDFAFNLHNTIRHLESDTAVLRHFDEMARALRPNGLYAVGISLSQYGIDAVEEDVWVGRRGRCTIRQLVQYLPPGTPEHGPGRQRVERVVSHVAVERPRGVEHYDSVYELRCYDTGQWKRLLQRSPLQRLATVDWWGRRLARRGPGYGVELLARRVP
jgi:SAM-dependent methyltransferase